MHAWSTVLRTILKTYLASAGNCFDYLLISVMNMERVLLTDIHIFAI